MISIESGPPGVRTTAAQRRAQAKVDYNAFLAGCPSRQLLDRISDKWVALILAALGSDGPRPGPGCVGEPRPMRYSELSRRLAGVSQKMLTLTARTGESLAPMLRPAGAAGGSARRRSQPRVGAGQQGQDLADGPLLARGFRQREV